MGRAIDKENFADWEYDRYEKRLRENLDALEVLLRRDDFGIGEPSIGAELELDLIDDQGRPLSVNRRVLAKYVDPHLQLELTRFNLEYNLSPVAAAGEPFSALQLEMQRALRDLHKPVSQHGGRIVTIGILPTLRFDDLQRSAMTDLPRYRALSAGLRRIRRAPFHIEINGEEPLDITCDDVTLEGANTSFQLHLRVNPADFAYTFNAAQLVTPLAVAVAGNSPIFLEHCLWEETRVALFKQAVDSRTPKTGTWRRASRVPFGHGWVRKGAFELFAESVRLCPPIVPLCDDEDPMEAIRAGRPPQLAELRLHQSTVWQWNRAVYDPVGDGHLRIELRALPSGPTPLDMMANAAFLIGLTIGFRKQMYALLPALPFNYAEYNFYRASQTGLAATLLWPSLDGASPVERIAVDLILDSLSVAREGLSELRVKESEANYLLSIIEARARSGQTASRWQRQVLKALDQDYDRPRALQAMLSLYESHSRGGRAVSEWPLDIRGASG